MEEENENPSVTVPLDLARTTLANVDMTNSMMANVDVSSANNTFWNIGGQQQGVIMQGGGGNMDLTGGTVTRIVSMSDLARLGITVSQGELGRVSVPSQDIVRVSVANLEQQNRASVLSSDSLQRILSSSTGQVKVGSPQASVLSGASVGVPHSAPHEIRITLPQEVHRVPAPQDVHRITIPQEYLPKTPHIQQASPRISLPQSSQTVQYSLPQEMSRISVPGITQMSTITTRSPSDITSLDTIDLGNGRIAVSQRPHIIEHRGEEQEIRLSTLQDSRLVGVPTMGRVIQMSELNRLAIPEMRIVLQSDTKIDDDDLDSLDRIPISQTMPVQNIVSESTGMMIKQPVQVHTIEDDIQELADSRDLIEQPPPPPQIEPTLIELVGQSIPNTLEIQPQPRQPFGSDDIVNRVADKTYPAIVQEEILHEYRTASRYDAIWKCNGGRYKVHRFVLALASPFLREILSSQTDDLKPVIYTPDFSSPSVKAILCLFYTGRVNVARDIMGEVNTALKMLHFNGDNVTVLPNQEIIKQEIVPDYDAGDFCEVEMQKGGEKGRGGRVKQEQEESDEDWDPNDIHTAFDTGIQGDDDEDTDDEWWEPKNKKRKLSSVKSERWSDDEDDKPYTGFKRGRKSLKTPDTHEVFRTRGPGKGERSYQLALDLFEGKAVDFIYVCHACYKIFDTFKKLALHKDDVHPDNPDKYGDHHTSSINQYNCPKCSQMVVVKHIAWFCKHLKFCRENNDIANALVGPNDFESDTEENGYVGVKRKYNKRTASVDTCALTLKDTEERLRITGEAKGKNVQTLSKILVGRVVDYIWACKLCYNIFLSEEALDSHRMNDHDETEKLGKYWNANTENYSCPFCEQVQNSRHLIWFIYHMRKCNMSSIPFIKKEVNEEEDTEDEDETEGDEHDPEQIILKTYNIKGDRADWICQALMGRTVERLFPCHVCYSVFVTDEELRQHFRSVHRDMGNRVRNGPYFDGENLTYNCPVCSKDVCRKQTNSIFFIYHFRKCAGQTFQIQKSCQDCGKEFTEFPLYKAHVDTHKAMRSFMCHVCTKVFPSNARLNYHVQYVHSSYKPYHCSKCTKSYKRKAELLEHEEMSHSTHFNYSCDKCGKQFYGKKNLALHMKTHYTEEEKKHVCNVCGYRFAKIKFLKNHLTTHSDIRQYACEICGARVKTRDTLKQHRKKLHNLLTPVPKNAQVEEQMRGETPGIVEQRDMSSLGEEQRIPISTHLVSSLGMEQRTISTVSTLDHRIISTIGGVLPKL